LTQLFEIEMKKEKRLVKTNETITESDIFPTKLNLTTWLILSILVGYLHTIHLQALFENDKHFSHLSTMEREMSFRTEAGLYYFYFKSLVTDTSLNISLNRLIFDQMLNDQRTEYPNTINALQRFNLYPEIFVAFLYRTFKSFNLLEKTCWRINREDDGMPAVESCEGLLVS
jgi:hypothetical protein